MHTDMLQLLCENIKKIWSGGKWMGRWGDRYCKKILWIISGYAGEGEIWKRWGARYFLLVVWVP